MYTIQTNASGTRSMEISEENLQTIEKYALFQHLIDSNGIVDESVLDKLKLNIDVYKRQFQRFRKFGLISSSGNL